MIKPIMRLENVSCRYKFRKGLFSSAYYDAIADISLSILPGETLGVIGGNGAGKSTLLRLLAGIILPDNGSITSRANTSVSLLTLQLGFSPDLAGRDNTILSAMLMGYSRGRAIRELDSIHEFSELGDWFYEPIKTYSTGMRARLGFAIALKMNPTILLVDEVIGVGDEAFRKKSTAAMKEKIKSGQTVVFVSHSIPTIKDLCTRLIWIEKGTIRMEGSTSEVLEVYRRSSNGRA